MKPASSSPTRRSTDIAWSSATHGSSFFSFRSSLTSCSFKISQRQSYKKQWKIITWTSCWSYLVSCWHFLNQCPLLDGNSRNCHVLLDNFDRGSDHGRLVCTRPSFVQFWSWDSCWNSLDFNFWARCHLMSFFSSRPDRLWFAVDQRFDLGQVRWRFFRGWLLGCHNCKKKKKKKR